jgi:hypothetical protein
MICVQAVIIPPDQYIGLCVVECKGGKFRALKIVMWAMLAMNNWT